MRRKTLPDSMFLEVSCIGSPCGTPHSIAVPHGNHVSIIVTTSYLVYRTAAQLRPGPQLGRSLAAVLNVIDTLPMWITSDSSPNVFDKLLHFQHSESILGSD